MKRAPSDVTSRGPEILRGRAALLQDVREGDDVILPKGTLGIWTGRRSDEAFSVRVDRESTMECRVPISACALVDIDESLPARHRVSIMFAAVVGSQAQALATDGSDFDRRGFYVASPEIQFGLEDPPAQLVHDADQLCFWEVGKFLRLALKANPTVLETLYSPEIEILGPAVGDELAQLMRRGAFLSKRAQHTFMGYADSQFEKMTRIRERSGGVKWSHAMHLIRLLRVGIRLMRTGHLIVVVPPDERAELLAIKQGERSWDEVCRLRTELVREFEDAARETSLPEEPDAQAVNEFLIQLRIRSVEDACR